jgi:sarcosine oxidase/L-pipecolate oxidase
LYTDTVDADFLIDRDPQHPGLIVASGGSGHGFKFAPVLGRLISAAFDGTPVQRFRWRDRGAVKSEGARHRG